MPVFHDEQYLKLVKHVLDRGVFKPDRTNTGTYSVFGYQMRFDLRDGTIPMLTSKKMHTRSIIHEILWYLQGADNIKYLKDNNVTIWDEWSSPEGHLKKVYGFQWRHWECDDWQSVVTEVPIRLDGTNSHYDPGFDHILYPNILTKDPLIGQRRQNNDGDWFRIIDKKKTNGAKNSTYKIQFEDTLSIVYALRPNLRRGQVADPYKITVFGEGCIGVYTEHTSIRKKAYDMWYNMMRRCYDTSVPEYYLYGGAGVYVDQQWRCFSNFLRDIHSLVYFTKWAESPSKYDLDKDYFGSKCYGPNTCIFLPTAYNQALPNLDGCKYEATDNQSGKTYEFTIQRLFAKQHGIRHSQAISTALNNSPTSSTKDWTFRKVQPRDGFLFRQRMYVDQIAELINRLKTNPNDRRMIVSAWNVADLPDMHLPPCHYTFQCYARPLSTMERTLHVSRTYHVQDLTTVPEERMNEILDLHNVPKYELSMILNQRSCDVGLGVPFNIVQYSILLRMIAEVVNMAPGEFIWNGGDVHIYSNHIEGLTEQLSRPLSYFSPTFSFAREVDNIDSFKYEDFVINNYQSHGIIKLPVAV